MEKTRIMPEGHWDWSMPVPFSQGWRVSNIVFTGGQVAHPFGEGDIEVQTRRTFENVTRVLEGAGASWKDVVKLNTYYVFNGPDEELIPFWERLTRVRMEFLANPGPAGTAVRVVGLAYPNQLIEVEAIAVVDD
jgi:enamine deaminase RidA (YjgF/YER057c/UK114 family)